jgi:hypothetical protein
VSVVEKWQIAEAGKDLPELVERVRDGDWQLIGDAGRAEVVLANAEQLVDLLAGSYRFRPSVSEAGAAGCEVWLPELGLHAAGESREAAFHELALRMLDYAVAWEQRGGAIGQLNLPAGYVRRVQLAGDAPGVLALLQRDAAADDAEPSPTPAEEADRPRRWMGPTDRLARMQRALESKDD